MHDICEHRFKSIDGIVEVRSNWSRMIEREDFLEWDTYMILKASSSSIFMSLFQKTYGVFKFNCEVENRFVLIRGVKVDILEFIELVEEEHPDFEYEISEISPLLVFNSSCKECNGELNIGKVIMATI